MCRLRIVERKHWNGLIILLLASIASAVFNLYIVFEVKTDNDILTNDLKFAISKHNDINHDLISANERIAELESANEALIGAGLR